ncbi:efflux RND transporter periplasmic adaptor subunit [Alkaliphilus pronyensis]|uniref:Efflux RND transporter periplasmic adaptor subunit n=1 Tax=Alkaliphilus pronyensis TaxID=1482732 RepID=A0A6I0F657_9FIRM|nr:efflux RND transporter periplasmic adaptor subunit [Alkaliphilus pronyensis]KAB3532425.1 efflux RND transporter periplasmic adaptor subunit [Alkaliphilus pronyensis]
MEKKSKKKLVIVLVALLVIAGISAAVVSASRGGKQGITVDAKAIELGEISVEIPANGMLEEIDKESVFHDINAKVEAVEVEVGDPVKKGQVLATLDSEEFGNRLDISKAQLEMEQLSLQRLKTSRQEAIDNIVRELEEVKSAYERSKELFESGGISQLEYNQSEKAYRDLQRSHQQYINNEDSLYYDIKRTEKQITISQLNIQDTQKEMEKLQGEITSPMDGLVTQVNVEKGSFTNPSVPAFVVADTANLQIIINVSEYDISKIQLGQEVEIETDALPDTVFSGEIEKIAPIASRMSTGQTNETVVPVTIKVIDQHQMLKPGFSVKTRIVSEKKDSTVVVPFDSIMMEEDKQFVFVISNDTLEKREVEIGIESDFHVEVTKGLAEGDIIVLRPNMDLKDGDSVIVNLTNNK